MVLQWVVGISRFVVLAVLLILGLAALYRYALDWRRAQWTWVTWGSGVATVLWVVASIGFSIYVNSFGNYNKTYGALAGIIILMFWPYLTKGHRARGGGRAQHRDGLADGQGHHQGPAGAHGGAGRPRRRPRSPSPRRAADDRPGRGPAGRADGRGGRRERAWSRPWAGSA